MGPVAVIRGQMEAFRRTGIREMSLVWHLLTDVERAGEATNDHGQTEAQEVPSVRLYEGSTHPVRHACAREELGRQIDDGEVVLGGCCVTDNDPAWQCSDCDAIIYRE
jgi:hypothetical protein